MTALAMEPRRAPPLGTAPRQVQKSCGCGAKASPAHEDCDACRVQRKPRGRGGDGFGGPAVDAVMATAGHPLAEPVRSEMEAGFGADFSRVRIHDDAMAAHAADAIDARAFALGEHIAFAGGHYDPASDAGRHLLAHELAHVVQQGRGGTTVQTSGAATGVLEREADVAADAVLAGRTAPMLSAAGPRVARAPATAATPQPPAPQPGATATILAGSPQQSYVVTLVSAPANIPEVTEPFVEVTVDRFHLPPTKGVRALAAYQLAPRAPLVRVPKDKGARASLKQDREPTLDLRDNWLQRVHWPKDQADVQWRAAGGDTPFPRAGGAVCHMDHVVELQLGGSGQPLNIQALDAAPNMDSGRRIRTNLADLSARIANSKALGLARAGGDIQLKMRFLDVVQDGTPTETPCQKVETAALSGRTARAEAAAKAKPDRKHHELRMPEGMSDFLTDNQLATPIETDPDNTGLRLAIPGLILTQLEKPARNGDQPLHARLDLETARLPLTTTSPAKQGGILFDASPSRPPLLRTNNTSVPIKLLYLSPGKITRIEPAAGGGINWYGEVTPTHRFLPKLQIAYADKALTITSGLDEASLKKRAPIPGARVTKAEIGIKLFPGFEPKGTLAFELAPGGRKLMASTVEIFNDDGLAAKGDVQLFIPGVKSATGQILYRDGQWSMSAKVETKDIDLPYLKGGQLTATYAQGRFGADGKLDLELPGKGAGSLRLGLKEGKWLFAGEGWIGHPRFGAFEVKVQDDGDEFVAVGHARPELKKLGLTPDITVTYRQRRGAQHPAITGKGSVIVDKPKLKGSLAVELLAGGKFTAKGEVSYPVRDDLLAKLGIELNEEEQVRVTGEARLTKPITLFARRGGIKTIKLFKVAVPIPGLSVGPAGVKFSLEAGITAGYGLGPAELRDVVATGQINPFEPDPDPVLDLSGTLDLRANGYVSFSIEGALVLDAVLADAKGYLTVDAGVEATGGVSLATKAHYERGFYGIKAVAGAHAELDLKLKLTAGVKIETILGDYGPGAEWKWTLAERVVPTGLGFSFAAPVSWDSKDGLKMPSRDEITWEPPKSIDVGDLMHRIVHGATKQEPAKGTGQ